MEVVLHLITSLKYEKMNIFNLVYKITKATTEKSCAVDSLKMAYI